MKRPPLGVLSLAIGSALSALLNGRYPMDVGMFEDGNFALATLWENAPFLGHCLVFWFLLIPLLQAIMARKVVHVPSIKISGWIAVFAGLIGASLVFSSFVSVSVLNFVEFAMMIGGFYAVTSSSGKKQSLWVIGGWFTGITLVALIGLREYADMKAIDPSWRIFANQHNPNQAGALLATGVVLGIPLLFGGDRLKKLGVGFAMLLQGLALFLTQSKGALVCLPVGLTVLAVCLLTIRPISTGKGLSVLAGVVILLGGLGFAAQTAGKTQTSSSGAAPMSRFSNSGEASTQSAGFRKQLWLSAIDLSIERPYGWGLGTFQFESTRPGRVTQTVLAHQGYLQLAAEASWLAPLTLIGFLVSVVFKGGNGAAQLPAQSKIILCSSFGALGVLLAHNAIDSDLYINNLGMFVFMLCGAVCASSADSQSPEVIFRIPKMAVAGAVALFMPLSLSIGFGEMYRAQARGALARSDAATATELAKSSLGISLADGYAHSILARATGSLEEAKLAASLAPSPKNHRAVALMQLRAGDYQAAKTSYKRALQRDPQNFPALLGLMNAAVQYGVEEDAVAAANRLIEAEKSTYFTVTSQAEIIPIGSYQARLYLASLNPPNKAELLVEAVKGFIRYRDITVPMATRQFAVNPNANVGGEDKSAMIDTLNKAARAAKDLASLQPRDFGFDPAAEATRFEEAASGLIK
ncbi:MAG: O-antigen ligase family protein [Fimbriimonas sp.]|nr:O-antigen ligase family protein [Fimbriimonas sp.]